MHRRDRHVVMFVLHLRQPAGQRAFVMVVQVAEDSDTKLCGSGLQPLLVDLVPQQVAERLGTTFVAVRLHESIEGIGQRVIDRDRKASHGYLPTRDGAR